ncbi:Lrp/AsnC ligand binding domain-containing protein [Falsiroseomonas sp. E2-1-a4]|uniref:Lrp/AsnC ligand binding domain-containing protein n=1 Tax=Falsiroseomonas sp. E2-1-a4 TaxID=3239299 RepID=UPI003F598D9B
MPRRQGTARCASPFPPRRRRANLRAFEAGVADMRAIFVMVKCEMGQAYRVAREMADGIPELSEMHSTSGQYDLLGKFYLETDQDIGLFVVERVQSVPGVKDTYTLQTFNAFSGGKG